MIYVLRFAALDIDNHKTRAALRITNLGAPGNIFRIGGLSHIVRHDGVFRTGGWFTDRSNDVLTIGRKVEGNRALSCRQTKRFPLFAFLAFLLLLFPLLRLLTHCIQKRAFFFLQILLTVRATLLSAAAARRWGSGGPRSAAARATVRGL